MQYVAALAFLLIFTGYAEARHHHQHIQVAYESIGEQVVPNPAGCPRIAFCGCGVCGSGGGDGHCSVSSGSQPSRGEAYRTVS